MTEPASCAQTGGAVLAEIALLEMEGMDLAFLQAHHRLAADLQIVGMRDLVESQRLDFRAGVSDHVGEGGIGLKDAAIEADNGDANRRILHGPAEALLALGNLATVVDDLADEQRRGKQGDGRYGDGYLQAELQRVSARLQRRQQDRCGQGNEPCCHQDGHGALAGPRTFPSQPRHNAIPPNAHLRVAATLADRF